MSNRNASLFNWVRLVTSLIAGLLSFNLSAQPLDTFPPATDTNPDYFWWLVALSVILFLLLLAVVLSLLSRRRTDTTVVEETRESRRPRRVVPEEEAAPVTPVRPVVVEPVVPVAPAPEPVSPAPPPREPEPRPAEPPVRPQPQGIVVTLTPGPRIESNPGDVVKFTATVTGTPNTAVGWAYRPRNFGNLNVSGNTAEYSVPKVNQLSRVRIIAVSKADGSKSADTEIVIAPLAPASEPAAAVTVKVSPETAELGPGQSQKFTATIEGNPRARFIWTAKLGSFDQSSGEYKAPDTIGSAAEDEVKATLITDASITGTAKVFLKPAEPVESVAPPVVIVPVQAAPSAELPKGPFEGLGMDQQERIACAVIKARDNVDNPSQEDVNVTIAEAIGRERLGEDIRANLVKAFGADSEAVKKYDHAIEEKRTEMKKNDTEVTRRTGGRSILPVIALLMLLFTVRTFAATSCGMRSRGGEYIPLTFTAADGITRTFECRDVLLGANTVIFANDADKPIDGVSVTNVRPAGYSIVFDLKVDKGVPAGWMKMIAAVNSGGRIAVSRGEGHPIQIMAPGQSYSAQGSYNSAMQYTDRYVEEYVNRTVPGMVSAAVAAAVPPTPLRRGRPSPAAPAPGAAPPAAPPSSNPRYDRAYSYAVLALRISAREPLRSFLGPEAGEKMYRDFLAGRVSPEQVFDVIEGNRTDRISAAAREQFQGGLTQQVTGAIDQYFQQHPMPQAQTATPVSDQHIRDLAREEAETLVAPVRVQAAQASATADAAMKYSREVGRYASLALEAYQATHDKGGAKRDNNRLRDKKVRNRAVYSAVGELYQQQAPPPPPQQREE